MVPATEQFRSEHPFVDHVWTLRFGFLLAVGFSMTLSTLYVGGAVCAATSALVSIVALSEIAIFQNSWWHASGGIAMLALPGTSRSIRSNSLLRQVGIVQLFALEPLLWADRTGGTFGLLNQMATDYSVRDISELRAPLDAKKTGGSGGNPYRWICPPGTTLSELRSGVSTKDKALARLQAVCRSPYSDENTEVDSAPSSAVFGKGRDAGFELRCPGSSEAVGIFGREDGTVRAVGLICRSTAGRVFRTELNGAEAGHDFQVECAKGQARGVVGRAGDLIDAVGVLCPMQIAL
jgi:hypothetical protein